MKIGKFISRYLRASDVKEPLQVTVRTVAAETVGHGDDAEEKAILYFAEIEQGVVLNKTNAQFCSTYFGSEETNDWVGKKALLTTELVRFQGKMVPGITLKPV